MPPAPDAPSSATARALSWKQLRSHHEDYHDDYWRECRALTTGGRRLLRDKHLLHCLFPQHTDEPAEVYRERCARAFFIPYPGEIIGDLVAQFAQDPVRCEAQPEADAWYNAEFFRDVDRQGMTLLSFVQNRVREALQVRVAWTLVDFPASPEETPASLADEEAAGLRRAYLVPLDAEEVRDWEEDEEGELLWACLHRCRMERGAPGRPRVCVERFTFYDREGWTRYEVRYDPEKEGEKPKDTDLIEPSDEGSHSFGAVPLLRLELPEGLWALDKLHSIARAHFQQRNAFSWSQYKHLFPLLVAYLGPEAGSGGEVPSEVQSMPERAVAQTYGTGRVHSFGKDDRLEFTAPDASVFTVAQADLAALRDEMHRVTATMASTIDNTAAAVGRSGESKQQDKSSREIVLAALGVIALDHVHDLLRLIGIGRGEGEVEWTVMGLSEFDSVSAREAVEEAQLVEGLTIPSPTFWRTYRGNTAGRILRGEASPALMEKIRKEIDRNTPDEDFGPAAERRDMEREGLAAKAEAAKQGAAQGGEEPGEGAEGETPAQAPKKKPAAKGAKK